MDQFVDFFTKKNIKLKFPINIYDSFKDIKEKIFISYNLKEHLVSDNTIAISNGQKYITNDTMTNEIFKSKNMVVYTFTEELINYVFQDIDKYLNVTINSPVISEIYNGFKPIYTNLTKNDITFTILYILNNVLYIDLRTSQLEQLYIQVILQKQKDLINKYLTVTQEFKYKETDYIYLNNGLPVYSVINSIVYYPILSKSKLDIYKLIKEYPVDTVIPIMLTIENKEPILKIHKSLPKETIEKWYLKDNKELKKINGLTFKLKIDKDNYANALLVDGNRISIRMSWDAKTTKRFEDIITSTSEIHKFIKNTTRIFPNKQVKLGNPYHGFLNLQFFTKKRIHLSKIHITVKKNFSNIFNIDEGNRKKEFLKLVYLPLKNVILVRYTTNSSGEPINIIDILGIKNENQINTVINVIVKLLAMSDTKKHLVEFKNFEFVSVDKESTPKKKSNKNIHNLKELGFKLDTVSCQRERQPRKSSNKNTSDTSRISFRGEIYECPNPDYPYPGFTNKNTLCCFKKDQKNKDVYKRNIQESLSVSQISDSDILKQRVIATNKLLEVNRLGLLPKILYNVFDQDYLRLGTGIELVSLLNVATNNSINPGNSLEIEKLEKIYNLNIIVFNVKDEEVSCKEIFYFKYPQTVFVLKNFNNYELIVKKIKNDKLCKTFKTKSEITSKILDLYKKSCIVNYIGYPETPMTFAELPFTIQAQVTNKFNKVIYVFTKEAGLLPVVPTSLMSDTKIVNISNVKMNATKQFELIKNINIKYIQISGQITHSNFTVGLVTKSGLIIPTKKSSLIPKLPIIYRQFIDNIDDLIYDDNQGKDNRYIYMTTVKYYQELYQRLKYTLSKKINNVKEDIEKAKKDNVKIKKIIDSVLKNEITFIEKTKIHRYPSTRNVCSDLKNNCSIDPFCKKVKDNCLLYIESKIYNAFLERLAIEILWNKDILTGNIINEFYGEKNFIKRKNEIVLLGKDSLKKFFQKN